MKKSIEKIFPFQKKDLPLHPQNVPTISRWRFAGAFCFALKLNAGIAQLVECQPSKLNVASSSLVARSRQDVAALAQW